MLFVTLLTIMNVIGQNAPVTKIGAHEITTEAKSLQVPVMVTGMYDVRAISLRIKYDPLALVFTGISDQAFPELMAGNVPGMISIGAFGTQFNMTSGVLCVLNFATNGKPSALEFIDHGESCEYAGGANIIPFVDIPYDKYYINGSVSVVKLSGKAVANIYLPPDLYSVCAQTPVTFKASTQNMGSNPIYQWRVNNIVQKGFTDSTFTYTPKHLDKIRVFATSTVSGASVTPVGSVMITMTVMDNKTPVATITQSVPQPCLTHNLTFTVAETNGSAVIGGVMRPAQYKWKVNGNVVAGQTSPTYTYVPNSGDVVNVEMTSAALCVTQRTVPSNNLIVTTLPTQGVVKLNITASAYSTMSNTPVTYTATLIDGGSNPTYQWYVNGFRSGTNKNTFTHTPENDDVIHCVATTTLVGCYENNPAISNKIKANVFTTGVNCTPSTITYEGKTYHTVQIGSQCWLRENMNVGVKINTGETPSNNNVVEKYCLNNDENNCNTLGGLYTWDEMMNYNNGSLQGVCPDGWRVATTQDYEVLAAYTKLNENEVTSTFLVENYYNQSGVKLKNPKDWQVDRNDPNGNPIAATNETGWSALPSGLYHNGRYMNSEWIAQYWTSSLVPGKEISPLYGNSTALVPVYWQLNKYNNALVPNPGDKSYGLSVRCLKN